MNMTIKIKQTMLKSTSFLSPLVKGTSVTLNTNKDCVWFLACEGKTIVGAVCAVPKGLTWRFKSDIVGIAYRGKGVYRKLWDARMKYVMKQGAELITTYSSLDSRPMYLKEGFDEISNQGNDNMYMTKKVGDA